MSESKEVQYQLKLMHNFKCVCKISTASVICWWRKTFILTSSVFKPWFKYWFTQNTDFLLKWSRHRDSFGFICLKCRPPPKYNEDQWILCVCSSVNYLKTLNSNVSFQRWCPQYSAWFTHTHTHSLWAVFGGTTFYQRKSPSGNYQGLFCGGSIITGTVSLERDVPVEFFKHNVSILWAAHMKFHFPSMCRVGRQMSHNLGK